MNGRKREGTVEILRSRRTLRRRKPGYKTKVEVLCDAAWEVGGGHTVAKKARTAKPAGAKGLYSSRAFEGRRDSAQQYSSDPMQGGSSQGPLPADGGFTPAPGAQS